MTIKTQTGASKIDAINLINRSKRNIKEIGDALREIKEREGYAALGYDSFAEYCEEELGYSEALANAFIEQSIA